MTGKLPLRASMGSRTESTARLNDAPVAIRPLKPQVEMGHDVSRCIVATR